MYTTSVEPFYVIGLSIRTKNENEKSARDMEALWNNFFSGNIIAMIPNKADDTIYCVYTEYEQDYTKPYTTILGCRVHNLNEIPEGLSGKLITGGTYQIFTAKGNIAEGIVLREWQKIWNADISRNYTSDFEVYGEKTKNQHNAEVDIFIALK